MAIGVIVSFACPQTGSVNAQAATTAPNARDRAETNVDRITMSLDSS
jgi:hypothetical protein